MNDTGICLRCNTIFIRNVKHRKYCQECSPLQYGKGARRSMRKLRRKLNGLQKPCQVCGYDEVVDMHYEDTDLYWLCPNHHALITRGVKQIEDFSIEPVIDILPES